MLFCSSLISSLNHLLWREKHRTHWNLCFIHDCGNKKFQIQHQLFCRRNKIIYTIKCYIYADVVKDQSRNTQIQLSSSTTIKNHFRSVVVINYLCLCCLKITLRLLIGFWTFRKEKYTKKYIEFISLQLN